MRWSRWLALTFATATALFIALSVTFTFALASATARRVRWRPGGIVLIDLRLLAVKVDVIERNHNSSELVIGISVVGEREYELTTNA
jgi:hypothetical protein